LGRNVDETVLGHPRNRQETDRDYQNTHQKAGDRRASVHSQRNLQRIPQNCFSRSGVRGVEVMIEIVATFLVLVSASVFVAHAFDAYRELSS
jgi:hypothetical protein